MKPPPTSGGSSRAAHERGLDLTARITGVRAQLCLANGDASAAAAGLAEAVGLLGADDPLLDRASLHHALGRVLLAQGRRRPALDELHAAYDLLATVGAEPFLRRVEADLAGAGITTAPQGSRSPLDLTERERDVVALVAKGLTNREVAAELYIGDKTVEYHLRNVFAKLGVTSRRQLRNYLSSPMTRGFPWGNPVVAIACWVAWRSSSTSPDHPRDN